LAVRGPLDVQSKERKNLGYRHDRAKLTKINSGHWRFFGTEKSNPYRPTHGAFYPRPEERIALRLPGGVAGATIPECLGLHELRWVGIATMSSTAAMAGLRGTQPREGRLGGLCGELAMVESAGVATAFAHAVVGCGTGATALGLAGICSDATNRSGAGSPASVRGAGSALRLIRLGQTNRRPARPGVEPERSRPTAQTIIGARPRWTLRRKRTLYVPNPCRILQRPWTGPLI
jgi:hypothetical protein